MRISLLKPALTIITLMLIVGLGFIFFVIGRVLSQPSQCHAVVNLRHSPMLQVYEFYGPDDDSIRTEMKEISSKFDCYIVRYELDDRSELSKRFQKRFEIESIPAVVITDREGKVLACYEGEEVAAQTIKTLKVHVFGTGDPTFCKICK